jgi:hypothetical protein
MLKLKSLITFIINRIKCTWIIRFYILDLFTKQKKESNYSKYVIFDLKSFDKDQIATVLTFRYLGFKVFISIRTFFGMDSYVRKIIKRSHLQPIIIRKTYDFTLFTDSISKYNKYKKSSIFLKYNFFDKSKNDPFITFPFHIGHYLNNTMWVNTGKEHKNRIKILFIGSASLKYSNKSINGFNVIARNESIDIIRNRFPLHTYCPKSKAELFEELESGRLSEKIVLVLRENFSLSKQDYALLLGESDFFLALPGMVNPISHNLTESLYAGSIPICQYIPLYDPALIGLCLEYNNEQELAEKIGYALKIDTDEINKLQEGIEKYILQRNQLMHDLVNRKFTYAFVNTEKLSLYTSPKR